MSTIESEGKTTQEGAALKDGFSRGGSFDFALRANGLLSGSQGLSFHEELAKAWSRDFTGQRVSFFGPGPSDVFYSSIEAPAATPYIKEAFAQDDVLDVITKYRGIDHNQAGRIAFVLGGLVRYITTSVNNPSPDAVTDRVRFVARMVNMANGKSADAVAAASAMLSISDGTLHESNFARDVYYMTEAIDQDDIVLQDTRDLGFSQLVRLRNFSRLTSGEQTEELPNLLMYEQAFQGFPTVGAEFHLPLSRAQEEPSLWQRLAVLNMSQFQRGSYIQMSRNDRGVVEVRMNPSYYPVTVLNWQQMKAIVPELEAAFFTVTINRPEDDFSWIKDRHLLEGLRSIGMLTYSNLFSDKPVQRNKEEINFGQIYLGQTLRLAEGRFRFSGTWQAREREDNGQVSIYAGFGDNLPDLTYFLSMALANPGILSTIDQADLNAARTIEGALAINYEKRKLIFRRITNGIKTSPRLSKADSIGQQVIDALS